LSISYVYGGKDNHFFIVVSIKTYENAYVYIFFIIFARKTN